MQFMGNCHTSLCLSECPGYIRMYLGWSQQKKSPKKPTWEHHLPGLGKCHRLWCGYDHYEYHVPRQIMHIVMYIYIYYIIMSKNVIIDSQLFTYHIYIYVYPLYIYIYIYVIFIQLYLSIHDFWPPHCPMSGCAVRWIQWVPDPEKHQIHIDNHWWTHGSVYSL
jgi:hypothetical protein